MLLDSLPRASSHHATRDTAAASPLATAVSSAARTPAALRLAEDALVSQNGAVAVQLPTRGRRACTGAEAAASGKVAGVLWHGSRGWLAVRLLFIVSLCRGLQAIARHLRTAPHASAVLTDLYTHTLTRPQPAPAAALSPADPPRLQALPPLPPPALGVFVGCWSSAHAAVQEAAQLIVSACAAPLVMDAAQAAAMHARQAVFAQSRGSGGLERRGPDSLRDLSTRGTWAAATPLFGWEAVPEEADGHEAAAAAGATVSLLPQEVLGILREAPQHDADPMQVRLASTAHSTAACHGTRRCIGYTTASDCLCLPCARYLDLQLDVGMGAGAPVGCDVCYAAALGSTRIAAGRDAPALCARAVRAGAALRRSRLDPLWHAAWC